MLERALRFSFLLWAFLLTGAACIAADEGGILLVESGSTTVKPSRMEIDLVVAGQAELSSDAADKYRNASRVAADAIRALKIKNLKIESRGLQIASTSAVNAMAIANGQPATGKSSCVASSTLRVIVTGIAEMNEQQVANIASQIIDTAKDNGVKTFDGTSNPVQQAMALAMSGEEGASALTARFVVEDIRPARDAAFRQAYEKAKARAKDWAAVAGVKPGKLISLEESDESMALMTAYAQQGMGGEQSVDLAMKTSAGSNRFAPVSVHVTVKVRFAVEH